MDHCVRQKYRECPSSSLKMRHSAHNQRMNRSQEFDEHHDDRCDAQRCGGLHGHYTSHDDRCTKHDAHGHCTNH